MDEHVAKPVDVELLVKVIHKSVEYNWQGSDREAVKYKGN